MKISKLMIVVVWIIALFVGAFSQDRYFSFVTPVQHGTPKGELPPTGSVLRMEAVFDDGTFVAVYAGRRLYYVLPQAMLKAKVILEPGKSYEIIDQSIQNGGRQRMLALIVK